MKLWAVISDIHGSRASLENTCDLLIEKGVTTLLIAGDFGDSLDFPEDRFDVIPVKGNCDGRQLPVYRRIPWSGRTILLTHGHLHIGTGSLKPGDLHISGHTHRPRLDKTEDGIFFINPGSLALPRGGFPPTLALIQPGRAEICHGPTLAVLDWMEM